MPQIVEIRRADDPRDVIHRACQLLAEGQLVVFPTETAYVPVTLSSQAAGVDRLLAASPQGIVLALQAPVDLHDFVAQLPKVADKFSRRAWPGPLTMEFNESVLGGLFRSLPDQVRQALKGKESAIGFRVPASDALLAVQRLCASPLLMARDSGPDRSSRSSLTRTAADAEQLFGDRVALIIDDGPCRYGEACTTVRFEGEAWSVSGLGVVSARNLERLASEMVLFVCTGNTCRSPMAEALFRRHLSSRLKCAEDELMDRGYSVVSAGLAAHPGGPASEGAINALMPNKIDLRSHESQPATSRLLNQADHILAMTRGHLHAIVTDHPELASRARVLSPERQDVSDPFGGDAREYEMCRAEIEQHVVHLIEELLANR